MKGSGNGLEGERGEEGPCRVEMKGYEKHWSVRCLLIRCGGLQLTMKGRGAVGDVLYTFRQ